MNKIKLVGVCLLLLVGLLTTSCRKPRIEPTPYVIDIPFGFPTRLNVPEDNPMTKEGVALGKLLFEDEHLCGYQGSDPDSLMSCAYCHVRSHNYDFGLDNPHFPEGYARGRSTGKRTIHNVMPLTNLVFNNEGYFWNGSVCFSNPNASSIEDIVRMAILSDDEMCGTEASAVAAIRANSRYPEMFKAAFGSEEITMVRIQKAIAQYVRSLVSGNSKFDRYLKGREQLTPQELHGYILFTTEEGADCFHCHGSEGSPLFTTNLFYNNGLDAVCMDDHDRYAFTGDVMDKGAYRAPSLRNVMVSAPYMHDGRFKNIDEVLTFYNEGLQSSPYVSPLMHKLEEGGRHLTPAELSDIKAFLETLTDDEYLGSSR